MKRIKTLKDKVNILAGYALSYSAFLIVGSIVVHLSFVSPRMVDFAVAYGISSVVFLGFSAIFGFRVTNSEENPPANI